MFKTISLAAVFTTFAATAFACPDWQADANFGDLHLTANFTPDPYEVETVAGGDIDVSTCIEGAYGYVTSNPDFDFYWDGESSTGELYIKFVGAGDTTMLINGPDEDWFFNDDADGVDPIVKIDNPGEGLYSVWIGTVDQQPVTGTFQISELP